MFKENGFPFLDKHMFKQIEFTNKTMKFQMYLVVERMGAVELGCDLFPDPIFFEKVNKPFLTSAKSPMITKNFVRIYLPLVDVNHIQAVLTPEITDAVVFLIPDQFCIFCFRSTS